MKIFELHIIGLVQGVGFRPFIYRIALEMGLGGEVYNDSSGVVVRLNYTPLLNQFIHRIKNEAPLIANVVDISVIEVESDCNYVTFSITSSKNDSGDTQISPDIGICEECLVEFRTNSRRHDYPFTNCTYCGPRFSIIESLPYDRRNTTMSTFTMCSACHSEYVNPRDRRFHAQPIACASCGPQYHYSGLLKEGSVTQRIIRHLKHGDIVMLKGMGGYNLLCDATNVNAVARLRKMKSRPRKAFAIMVSSVEMARKWVEVTSTQSAMLTSWRRPIVVCDRIDVNDLSGVAPLFRTLGIMLPYMAIHYDLFDKSELESIVVTSANYNGAPMIIDDDEAYRYSADMNLPLVSYNRVIHNRIDDSVVACVGNRSIVLRRGRGYAPEPLFTQYQCNGIVGMGAEIVPHFAIGLKDTIISSQYIGALTDIANEKFYRAALKRYFTIFNFKPRAIAVDAHPLYQTSHIGRELAGDNLPIIPIWHHHAHAVAIMAEYGLKGDVLALCLDGTGYGNDNNIWGGEILKCNISEFLRLWHLPYLNMPGGNAASVEGWRMAISMIMNLYDSVDKLPHDFVRHIGIKAIRAIENMILTHTNSPLTSGAGRVFDAVSALLGVSYENTYESESPMLLEQVADPKVIEAYPVDKGYKSIFDGILEDISNTVSVSTISAKFHNSFSLMLVYKICKLAKAWKIQNIVLSGGVFQNRILLQRIEMLLVGNGLNVYIPTHIPINDANIAVGQIVIAANRIESK